MKLNVLATIIVSTFVALLGSSVFAGDRPDNPNIVVVLCDDLGYGDLECYGHPHIKTPHLNRLAKEGIRFTNFYSAAPVCSPARVGLLTGRSPKIRLRGPCMLLRTENGTQPHTVRVQIPCKIEPALFEMPAESGNATYLLKRTFNKPTRLDPSQKVTLELSHFDSAQRLVLNRGSEQELEQPFEGGEMQVDVTECLLESNALEIEFDAAGFAGDVLLVIEG